MKIVIFGLGSIGRRHAEIFKDNFNHEIFAFRVKGDKSPYGLKIRQLNTWSQVRMIKPDIAWITNPTFMHVATAIKCASLKMHLFIEKPLSHSLKDIALLDSICRKNKLTCYVAYCLRFHPVIARVHQIIRGKEVLHARVVCSTYLPEWRKVLADRRSYSAYAKMGGGALLDLSHEFDYIEYLFGSIQNIKGNYGRVGSVTADAEDFADVICKTKRSVYVNLHLNLFSRFPQRQLVINLKNGYIIADLTSNSISLFLNNKPNKIQFTSERNDYLREQTEYFLANINNRSIMNNLSESRNLLDKILSFKNGKR